MVDYRRYSLGTYGRDKWIECHECGTAEKPFHVWQGTDRSTNFAFIFRAVIEHETVYHSEPPVIPGKKR